MLRAAGCGPQVVVCTTCRVSADARPDAAGQPDGALLAGALRTVRAAQAEFADITIEDMPCLFACAQACTVHVRDAGKIGYVLGGFAPDEAAARAILTYAAAHAASAQGVVPYQDWPEGVKGRFIVRVPPEGFVAS